jgi:hypothetical protein
MFLRLEVLPHGFRTGTGSSGTSQLLKARGTLRL